MRDPFWNTISNNSFTPEGETQATTLEIAKKIAIWRPWEGLDEATWDLIERFRVGRALVDFGCGYGRLLKIAHAHGFYPTAVDCDDLLMKRCEEFCGVTPIHVGDWEADIKEGLTDTIYTIECIQHIDDPILTRVQNIFDRKTHKGSRIINIGEPHAAQWACPSNPNWKAVLIQKNCLPEDPFPRTLSVFEKIT